MFKLESLIRSYAWGSRTALASLLGRDSPTPEPQSELWLGAHPEGTAFILRGNERISLLAAIRQDPKTMLGAETIRRFGNDLPFLFKVLAAEQPLSLQAHPSEDQAQAGYAMEERLGIARDAPNRMYRDRNHKPELICALEPFEILCGFRSPRAMLRLFERLAVPSLAPFAVALARKPTPPPRAPLAPGRPSYSSMAGSEHSNLQSVFTQWLTAGPEQTHGLIGDVVEACERVADERGEYATECEWICRLAVQYPGDPGVLCSLLLNYVRLEPGDGLFLPAGRLHTYLRGVGLEIMSCSDNVLRGGLTHKHVNVQELLRVLDFTPSSVEALHAQASAGVEQVYPTPAKEFRLSRIDLDGSRPFETTSWGPEIVLCTRGEAIALCGTREQRLGKGDAVFVPAECGPYEIRGDARLFRAAVAPF